ncbi:peptidyl-prolyl cis-trans isomerase CYP37, chloroplastic [Sesamum indicum]|uniref:Peptidyl-prolyl cis-trans isomerase CYP37, chloroplastic n=1 Tax=Sesamum indicum TaxID=4182 RepID=A0A6I9UBL3_SESIN|nr:peptidyl-prolyl cis-trans isomerase CYP37, chloroplastic [Sesamum indicum]
MAFPLSASIFSPNKLSLNLSSTRKSTSSSFTTHFALPYTPREPASAKHISPEFKCILARKDDGPMELVNGSNYFSNLETWLVLGRKQFERAFAASIIFLQLMSPVPWTGYESGFIPPAEAVLYSPETKIPRTGELALRRAIPANANMKAIQDSLEDISYLLRIPQRKPYGTMEGNVKKSLKIAVDEKESILSSIPAELREKGSVLYASLIDGKDGLKSLLESIKDKDADKVSVGLASTLDTVAQLELLQAPGLQFLLPQQYLNYPRLTGRAVVEFAIEKGDGSTFSPEAAGQPRNIAVIQVVLDGYSAPLTAGNFAKLDKDTSNLVQLLQLTCTQTVMERGARCKILGQDNSSQHDEIVVDGAYDGVKLNCTDQAILSDTAAGKEKGYSVPLEIKPSGQFEPLYKTTLSVQDGELPVLPLSVYGAVVMAHSEVSEEYSSPNQFFLYLYDKRNAGLGGLSFDEGQFSVFGYTTVGRDILSQIKTGDVIRSAKLVEGEDRLVMPKES